MITAMAPIKEHTAEVALDVHAQLGEGPVWDERMQRLYFVDIMGHRVHAFDPVTKADVSFDVGRPVGAVVLREDGGLVLAAHDAFFLAEADGSGTRPFGNADVDGTAVRFNDGKVCPRGRFLAGTMAWTKRSSVGSLYLLDGDGLVTVLLEEVTISNGLAWSHDGRTVYYIDTPRHSVDAFDYDLETGLISNRRVVYEVPDASPDGMTIDSEGFLWVAVWGGSRVERFDPATGRLQEVVHVSTSHVSSVAFGGANLDDLFITTAREDLTDEELAAEPDAGNLFVVRPGVKGLPANRFKLQAEAA